ncbi:DNA recombination protein RmuC [Parasphingorhabdus pacifica]
MNSGLLTGFVIVLTVLFAAALLLIRRLYDDNARRADEAMRMVEAERARTVEQQAALRRYEVAFASITGRGELGEQVLVETARSLGLREGVHFVLQTDLAGGGAARPDLVLNVGGGRQVPVDAKASLAVWAEAMDTDDPEERRDALRVHVRNIRSRANELSGKGYQRWADAIYGSIMFVPSDAAVIAALDTDPQLLSWLLDKRVFLCGPTGFAVLSSAAMFAATERTIAEDIEQVRSQAVRAQRAASGAVDAVNLSSTHLQRFVSARRRELDALESFRSAVVPLAESSGATSGLSTVRQDEDTLLSGAAAETNGSSGPETD